MGCQYLLANNNSPEKITEPFEFELEIRKRFHIVPFPVSIYMFKVNNRNTRIRCLPLVFLLLTLSREMTAVKIASAWRT